jgi:hypothetical protein
MSRSTFTAEARTAIVARVEVGVPFEDAAQAAGVPANTAKAWLARGRREDSGAHADFAVAVDQAREAAQSRRVPMDEDELARVVSDAARAGSVQAMKLRWEQIRAAKNIGQEEKPGPQSKVDELAARRRRAS